MRNFYNVISQLSMSRLKVVAVENIVYSSNVIKSLLYSDDSNDFSAKGL